MFKRKITEIDGNNNLNQNNAENKMIKKEPYSTLTKNAFTHSSLTYKFNYPLKSKNTDETNECEAKSSTKILIDNLQSDLLMKENGSVSLSSLDDSISLSQDDLTIISSQEYDKTHTRTFISKVVNIEINVTRSSENLDKTNQSINKNWGKIIQHFNHKDNGETKKLSDERLETQIKKYKLREFVQEFEFVSSTQLISTQLLYNKLTTFCNSKGYPLIGYTRFSTPFKFITNFDTGRFRSGEDINKTVISFCEFGFQSYPSLATLSKSLAKEHLVWPIKPELQHRQHAPDQNNKLIAQITENFDFKNQNSTGQNALEEFIYLSQVSQALAIKLEAELYIRDRDSNLWSNNYSLRSNVQNLNMGSLVWQLNDVWQAPTWSSIDFYGNYKILQYYMRKFYNPIHVIANRENDTLVINLINDSLVKVKITIYVIIYKNMNGYLEPVPAATYKNVTYLDKLTVLKQNLNLKSRLNQAGCGNTPEQCFIRIDYTYLNFYLDNFYLLGKPKDLNLKPVEITSKIIKLPQAPKKYVVIVTCDQVALFVHLSWKDLNIEGHFIDNGFNILKTQLYILFESKEDYDLDYLTKNLKIRSINSN